jgi:hypothetical protein
MGKTIRNSKSNPTRRDRALNGPKFERHRRAQRDRDFRKHEGSCDPVTVKLLDPWYEPDPVYTPEED